MAREPIVYIDRNKQLYKGRDAQVAALAPFPARHDGDHWAFTRAPFAHAFFPGYGLERTGKEDPRLKAIKQAAIDAGIELDLVEALTMDQLMITPDLISANIGGRFITTSVTERRVRPASLVAEQYEPTGDFDSVSLGTPVDWTDLRRTFRSSSTPTPIYVREISWTSGGSNNAESGSLSVTGVGTIWSFDNAAAASGLSSGRVAPNKLITSSGAQLVIELEQQAGGTMGDSFSAIMIYEHARSKG